MVTQDQPVSQVVGLAAGELAQRMEAAFWHFIQVMKYGSWSHEIDKMFLAKLRPKDLDMEVDQAWLEGVQLGACHRMAFGILAGTLFHRMYA